jgi:hypothetical protein
MHTGGPDPYAANASALGSEDGIDVDEQIGVNGGSPAAEPYPWTTASRSSDRARPAVRRGRHEGRPHGSGGRG